MREPIDSIGPVVDYPHAKLKRALARHYGTDQEYLREKWKQEGVNSGWIGFICAVAISATVAIVALLLHHP